jgi:uncharacterized protein
MTRLPPFTPAPPPADDAASEALQRILQVCRPQRVILFGSRARGEATLQSDLDLLIVLAFSGSRVQATLPVLRALADLPAAKDVLVLTPEEWETKRHLPGTLAYPADREGHVLYAG